MIDIIFIASQRIMISPSASAEEQIVLTVALDNFQPFSSQLSTFCLTHGGESGSQILQDEAIPLYPFPLRPTKNDLDLDSRGKPIPNQYRLWH